jgi:hypothetical protein
VEDPIERPIKFDLHRLIDLVVGLEAIYAERFALSNMEHADPVLDSPQAHVHLVGGALEFKEQCLAPLGQQKVSCIEEGGGSQYYQQNDNRQDHKKSEAGI